MRTRSEHLMLFETCVYEQTSFSKNVSVRKPYVLSSRIRVAEGLPKMRKSEKEKKKQLQQQIQQISR